MDHAVAASNVIEHALLRFESALMSAHAQLELQCRSTRVFCRLLLTMDDVQWNLPCMTSRILLA